MSDLLLITDVPRLRKVFSRLADERNLRLRVAASLEKGAEEIVSDKPAMIFVQTHLSGFSADILLMHLKKQLGRRRSRFVLLSPPEQVNEEVRKLYHDQVDSSLEDQPLFEALIKLLDARAAKSVRETAPAAAPASADVARQPEPAGEDVDPYAETGVRNIFETTLPVVPDFAPAVPPLPTGDGNEPTLEEQGVVYAPRPQLSVYSEFTSSFESAVSSMPAGDAAEEPLSSHSAAWQQGYPETIESKPLRSRSKKVSFLLWALALLAVVVGITVFQHRSSTTKTVELAPPAVVPAEKPAASGATAAPDPPAVPAAKPPAAEPDARLSDRAIMSAIEENRSGKGAAPPAPGSARLKTLPEFIPRSGLDKAYSAANPGWERYKGQVTEFKVFREGEFIKAVQVIDRGGQGVPESFMQGVQRQLTRAPAFVQSSSEKKDGYEIQRGQIADNLKVVYYRDAQGGRLRAFVLTWQ